MSSFMKLAVFVSLLWASAAMAQTEPVMAAKIKGPLPVTPKTDEPYRGENEQPVAGPGLPPPVLIPYGYVEEEYFVSGTVDGKPYTTSLLVRKPKDPAKFSGLVAVETIHAQGAVPLWGQREVWMTGGHGWVGVGSQLVALEQHIKKANPKRYASLKIPEAPSPGGAPPANPFAGNPAQDTISQEIMTQVGALLKSNAKKGPFAGMTVKYLIMGGASQTGGTTLRYIQQSHAHAHLPDGKPIYDGYLPMEAFSATPVSASDAVIMHLCTEGDVMNVLSAKRPLALRPDGDAPNDRYRHYEYAGASHVGMRGVTDPLTVFSTLTNAFKPGEHLSQFPQAEMMRPGVYQFVDWLMKGVAPPKAAPIEVKNGEIVRDKNGNAKGGVRSPYVDLPTVRYIASAPIVEGDNPFRRLIGLQEPFAPEKLRKLYKSKENYLKLFNAEIDKMVTERWLMAKDGEALKTDEAKIPAF
jgi:Alpha/beta hydrolase domain